MHSGRYNRSAEAPAYWQLLSQCDSGMSAATSALAWPSLQPHATPVDQCPASLPSISWPGYNQVITSHKLQNWPAWMPHPAPAGLATVSNM